MLLKLPSEFKSVLKTLRQLAVTSVLVVSFGSAVSFAGDYAGTEVSRAFAKRMATEHGFDAAEVEKVLAGAKKQEAILEAIARPAEKSKPWFEYRKIFLDEKRIKDGVVFWREHEETLQRAEQIYGVSAEIIVAIIGVETRYGAVTGSWRVLDALATLGFDYPPRSQFFSKELEHFLLLTREQKQDASALKGSYAGAMGYGQFMPSSYRAYAADFDGDGVADIWNNPVDAIGSVGNYFKAHGWQFGEPVMVPADIKAHFQQDLLNKIKNPELSLRDLSKAGFTPALGNYNSSVKAMPLTFESESGEEAWLGFKNFYVITRYNRSPMYARAVWELSEVIKEQRAITVSAL